MKELNRNEMQEAAINSIEAVIESITRADTQKERTEKMNKALDLTNYAEKWGVIDEATAYKHRQTAFEASIIAKQRLKATI
jgi:hypothetical protein